MFALEQVVAPYGLAPLSLRVEAGERVALCGPNGAGKSTLIKVLAGLLPVDGAVRLGGRTDWAPRARARQVALVAQGDLVAGDFTVREAVAMGRYPHVGPLGRLCGEDHAAIDRALEQAELNALARRPVAQLSGGERQRVALARALAQDTPVLLLDEPTAHLDPGRAAGFLARVAALPVTVVCALHDLNLAALFAPRVILLAEGEVVADGPPAEVLTAARVAAVYGTELVPVTHPTGAPQFLPGALNARS